MGKDTHGTLMLGAELWWPKQQGNDAIAAGRTRSRAGVAINDHGGTVWRGCDTPPGTSRSAVARPFGGRAAELGPGHHLHSIAMTTPPAGNRLDGLEEHLTLLDLVLATHVTVPELTRASRAGHIETSEVAAMRTTPPRPVIWKVSHAATLLNVPRVSPLA